MNKVYHTIKAIFSLWCLIGIPAKLCVVSAVIFGAFYPLTKEKLLEPEQEVVKLREANVIRDWDFREAGFRSQASLISYFTLL